MSYQPLYMQLFRWNDSVSDIVVAHRATHLFPYFPVRKERLSYDLDCSPSLCLRNQTLLARCISWIARSTVPTISLRTGTARGTLHRICCVRHSARDCKRSQDDDLEKQSSTYRRTRVYGDKQSSARSSFNNRSSNSERRRYRACMYRRLEWYSCARLSQTTRALSF